MTAAYPEYVTADSQWLDTVPAHWRVGRLDHVARTWPSNVNKHSVVGEPPVRLCNYIDVYKNASIVEDLDFMAATASPDQIERFRIAVGDTLLTKDSETADDIGVPAYVEYEARDLICGYHLSIVRPDPEVVEPKFLYWALGAGPTIGQWAVLASGVTRVGIRAGDLSKAVLAIPPLDEQRAIAQYLDRETARIDTLIEEQRRLIEMLRERRDSVWAEYVEVARRQGHYAAVRRVIDSIVDGPFGSSLTSAHYSDEGARVIRLGNIGVNEFKDGDAAFIPLDYAEKLKAHTVEKGDVVVAGLGDDRMPLGRAAVVPELGPAIVKADCYRLRPNEQVSAAYLAWVMSSPQTRSLIMLLSRGSTRARLNTKVVQQVEIPLPDRATQDELVASSDADMAKIGKLITEAERFIALSKERRAALITAAVTGQINVLGRV